MPSNNIEEGISEKEIADFESWLNSETHIKDHLERTAHYKPFVYNWFFDISNKHCRLQNMPIDNIRITAILSRKVIITYYPTYKELPAEYKPDFSSAKSLLHEVLDSTRINIK